MVRSTALKRSAGSDVKGMLDSAITVSSITFWASAGMRLSSSSTKLWSAVLLVMRSGLNGPVQFGLAGDYPSVLEVDDTKKKARPCGAGLHDQAG